MIYGYNSPMDRTYISDFGEKKEKVLGVKDIGLTMAMGIGARNIPEITSKIRAGAGNLEITFMGAGRGSQQAETPGMFGKYHRQALRELSKANEINLTTHASVGIPGLAGQDQQGNFSDEQRKIALDEVNRAIDFAGDTALGGSVVIHTGEFQRPISEEPWAEGGKKFRGFEEEPKRAVIRVVNKKTGQVLHQIRKNEEVTRPVWVTKNVNGKKIYTDYEGNPVAMEDRVPQYNKETGLLEVKSAKWVDFVEDAKEMTDEERRKKGEDFDEEMDTVAPEEAFLKATLKGQESERRGWALYYGRSLEGLFGQLERYNKEKRILEEDYKEASRDKKLEIEGRLKQIEEGNERREGDIGLRRLRRRIKGEKEMVIGNLQQADDQRRMGENVISTKKYALKKSFEGYALSGMKAMKETKEKELEKPLFITMENIFPESYGGHPQELKKLILDSRKEMVNMLKDEGHSESEAKELAKTHIKATLDTGHLNLWRKYFKGDDEEFKKWILDQTEDLAKSKIIGNVHLVDNFGYQDEHLAPGQGNTPVKEMIKILKKHGYKGAYTVECGSSATTDVSYFHGLMKTWEYLGSPVYSMGAARDGLPPMQWQNVQSSYFGQTYPPSFIFGAYVPSNEWTLWSGVAME
ncbi:MAG: sugar phosphate isomerase/epimerase [Nanoarchaeota archaeon]|nr:sugar phosphate isomerase/epimerase [Nanoarchaeota archaeon]